jgi:hypothetical protein
MQRGKAIRLKAEGFYVENPGAKICREGLHESEDLTHRQGGMFEKKGEKR